MIKFYFEKELVEPYVYFDKYELCGVTMLTIWVLWFCLVVEY